MFTTLRNFCNHGIIGRILGNRFVKWILRAAAFLFLLDISLTVLDSAGIISLEGEYSDFSTTNPYRDLPDDPLLHNAIREVLFIGDSLRDGLLPTSLPDDDYALYSNLLRSLETRQDISWLVMQETRIDSVIMAIANRGGSLRSAIPDEPHDLHSRAKALHDHWWNLLRAPEHPERWSPEFDTTLVPPLLRAKALGDSSDAIQAFHLSLEPGQAAEAEKKYSEYRSRRDWKVSYLKRNPPTPLAWAPIPQEQVELKSAWDSIFTDGIIEAGRHVLITKLAKNPKFKPIYRDLITERVPYSWTNPDSPILEKTDEEYAEESRSLQAEMKKMEVRRKKQEAFQQELAASIERARTGGHKKTRPTVKEEL